MTDTLAHLGSSPAMTAEPVASVRDLTVSLERRGVRSDIIRGVDLDIAPGEILGVVGESGSGKSVMSLALMGLLPAASRPQIGGRLLVTGVDMARARDAELRAVRRNDLGVVFQDPMTSLNPTMLVGAQVEERAGSTDEAVRLMRAVGIPQPERRFRSYPHELSGGLRQRIMIAMAIAGGPRLVIADEPTTALDVTVQAQVLAVLRAMRDEVGCSILMITHDLGVAGQIADRVAVMYAGRLAEVGTTQQVLEDPRHPYTLGLLGSRLSLTTDRSRPLRVLPAERASAAERDLGCAYHSRCPLATNRCRDEVPPLVEDVGPVGTLGLVGAVEPHVSACFFSAEAAERIGTPEAEPEEAVVPRSVAKERALAVTELACTFTVRDEKGRRANLAALRGVTLDVQEGESIALVGESGSGKSTLLRIAGALEKRYTGSIEGPGRGEVQMVFQDAGSSLTPWMTVGAILEERLGRSVPAAEKRARCVEMLVKVGLSEAIIAAKPSELSGGQRQRVALARATIVPPKILLCDEPTSALDVSLAANVLNLIAQLRADLGMTVIFVTHDLSVARIIGDRIAVMYLGRLVEIGLADEVISDPKHPYTRTLVAAVPQPGRPLPEIVGEPASPLDPPGGCAFHPRCPVVREDCSTTVVGTQLIGIGPRPPHDPARRMVACVHKGEI